MTEGDQWVNLGDAEHVFGYAVHKMTVVNGEGVGQGILLRFLTHPDEHIFDFLIDPDMAGQLGWEINGVVHNYVGMVYGDRLLPDDVEVEAFLAALDDDDEGDLV
jgi:hypothetical protein